VQKHASAIFRLEEKRVQVTQWKTEGCQLYICLHCPLQRILLPRRWWQ